MTLRIDRSARQRFTVFALSGRMEAEHIAELKELLDGDCRNVILDLRDLRLADRDAVRFLRGCEGKGMKLENCPAYVREWIGREKD
jgi:predicted metal-binding protein